MVFLNKYLLGGSEDKAQDAPLFITWFQCLVTVILCFVLSKAAQLMPGVVDFPDVGRLEKQKVVDVSLCI